MSDKKNINELQGNWNYPTSIRFGSGCINELRDTCSDLNISNPLLVTDSGLVNLKVLTDVLEFTQTQGFDIKVFSDIKPNPTSDNILQGLVFYRKNKCDGVIAFGGGSALDAGKTIALMALQKHDLWDFEDIGDNWKRVNPSGIASCIAIPTTAGTGSEVGRAAVIVDENTQTKKIIFHPDMMPVQVLADPELSLGLPASITAATGIDAFVHSLEAYCVTSYHPMADGIALESMRLIKEWLPKACADGNNLQARSHMLVASTMGATAFQKGLGGVHALAHPLGAIYDKHHGLLNAILLPYVLIKNKTVIENKISYLAHCLNIEDASFDGFLNWVLAFRSDLQIPDNLKSIGIDTQKSLLIGELASKDSTAPGNPVALTAVQYTKIFENAVNGYLR
jgi:alcohol dehydrogenase class IV